MPKVTYSKDVDAVYISFREGEYHVSVPLTDALILDVDEEGVVLGLEVLDAKSFFDDLVTLFQGKLELPEKIDPETFDPTQLLVAHA